MPHVRDRTPGELSRVCPGPRAGEKPGPHPGSGTAGALGLQPAALAVRRCSRGGSTAAHCGGRFPARHQDGLGAGGTGACGDWNGNFFSDASAGGISLGSRLSMGGYWDSRRTPGARGDRAGAGHVLDRVDPAASGCADRRLAKVHQTRSGHHGRLPARVGGASTNSLPAKAVG